MPHHRSRLQQLRADLEHDCQIGASIIQTAEEAVRLQNEALQAIQAAIDKVEEKLKKRK
jgi:hypothetical protein